MLVRSFKKLWNTPIQYISFESHKDSVRKLHQHCLTEISNMLNFSDQKKHDIILVAIERGGSIPCTLLNYALTKTFKEDLGSGLLRLHNLHVALSTRDRKEGNNKKALATLKKQIEEIISRNPGAITEGALSIYFVEDLLDSGATLTILNRAFEKEMWFGGGISTLLSCFAKKPLKAYQTQHTVIRLVAGKILNTNKWLDFWYEDSSK